MSIMRLFARLACAVLLSLALASFLARATAAQQPRADSPQIEIVFSKQARSEPVTGMVYVAISRDNRPSPIDETSPTGVPLFSHFVDGLAPDTPASITADDRGHPIRSLRD